MNELTPHWVYMVMIALFIIQAIALWCMING